MYFRTGYNPGDYQTARDWNVRLMLESSRAVLGPDVALQLLGAKKIQEALANNPSIMQTYIPAHDAALLESCFMRQMPLEQGLEHASTGKGWVLKPQREGGSEMWHDEDIPLVVCGMDKEAMKAYTLMEKIDAPTLKGILVRNGEIWEGKVVSELGVFGAVVQ